VPDRVNPRSDGRKSAPQRPPERFPRVVGSSPTGPTRTRSLETLTENIGQGPHKIITRHSSPVAGVLAPGLTPPDGCDRCITGRCRRALLAADPAGRVDLVEWLP